MDHKTSVYYLTLQRKVDSMAWKHPLSLFLNTHPEVQQLTKKLIAIVFFDAMNVLFIDFIAHGQKVNSL